ncbi:MAG TPA: MoaD/ThiS family protein, partial [Chloroflexota bacterium]
MVETGSPAQIHIHIRLFASYREAAGAARFDMPIDAGARVGDLIDLLAVRVPGLRTAPGLVAVNHSYV